MTETIDWSRRYRDLIGRIPDYVAAARMTLCGFSVCLDVYLSLQALDAACRSDDSALARTLLAELKRRAVLGIGGEFAMDWPGGAAWMSRNVRGRIALGGTSAQAANLLATLGAPALLSLADRSVDQLSVIHPDILIVRDGEIVRRKEIRATGSSDAIPHYIFEFTAGQTVGEIVLRRSSRVIVRFTDYGLQHDDGFERVSREQASIAGAGIISGFNELPPSEAAAEHAYAGRIATAWRKRGLDVVHLELGDYPDPGMRDTALATLAPAVTSFGASLSELNGILPGDEPVARRAVRLAERFGFARVCIHADEWALSVTRGDPQRELEALSMGCLVAAVRAEAGEIVVPRCLPAEATLHEPPLDEIPGESGWSVVRCPSPHLKRPAAAIGLGDTFLAGTLLVLGGNSVASRISDAGQIESAPP